MNDAGKGYGFWSRLREELPKLLQAILHPIATWRAFKEDDTE